MPRRKDSFSQALADAQKRLGEAMNQRSTFIAKLDALEVEIPRLQNIIASLGDKIIYPKQHVGMMEDRIANTPPKNLAPEEQAKWYTERDLSGVSSIPPGGAKPPAKQLSDDELLPDDLPGKPVLEK